MVFQEGRKLIMTERDILIRENDRLREKVMILEEKLEAIENQRQSEIDYPAYVEELKLDLARVCGERDAYEQAYKDLMNLLV